MNVQMKNKQMSEKALPQLEIRFEQNVANAIKYAISAAEDPLIQHSGITTDGSVVTTLECVNHQRKHKTLLLSFNGNWEWISTGMVSGSFKQSKKVTITNESIEMS